MKFLKIIGLFILASILLVSACIAWSFYEYKQIKVTQLAIDTSQVPPAFQGKKVVFAADFQYDTLTDGMDNEMLQKSVDMINAQHPDIIILGGDYINYAQFIDDTFAFYGQLKAPLGIYAVTGNHDQARLQEVYDTFESIGIQVIDNDGVWINEGAESIRIGGVEDWWYGTPDADLAIGDASVDDFVLMVTHNPDYFAYMSDEQRAQVDLTLAGHLHAGQVTFFGLHGIVSTSEFGERYRYGMKEDDNGNKMYVTSGLGGNINRFHMRFFAQPEIVVIDL